MMTRKTSQKVAIVKQIAIIPLIAALGFLFSTKVAAQDNPTLLKQKQTEYSKVDASQKLVDEYKAKLEQYRVITKEGKYNKDHNLTIAEKNELALLYLKLSKKQQGDQDIVFDAMPGPSPKSVPTKEKLEAWKNPNVYGVWIDGKKVDNSVLNKYANTDFSQGDATYVSKNARIGKKYFMQVDLMTNDYYKKYCEERITRLKNDKYVMGRRVIFNNPQSKKTTKELDSKSLLNQKVKLDNEQKALLNLQKKELDNKKDSKSLSDQKLKLDKEQQALLLDQQKKELDNKQNSKSLSDQKIKLEKEQRAEMNSLIIAKYEKDMEFKKNNPKWMKDQEAKIKELKIKLEKEQKAQQEQK